MTAAAFVSKRKTRRKEKSKLCNPRRGSDLTAGSEKKIDNCELERSDALSSSKPAAGGKVGRPCYSENMAAAAV